MTRLQKQTLETLRSEDFSAYVADSYLDGVILVSVFQGNESILINQIGEII
jgi:hypothetical protein